MTALTHSVYTIYNYMIPVLMEKNIGRNYLTIGGICLITVTNPIFIV